MQGKELLPGLEAVGLALCLKEKGILVFGDLHLGYEEELNKKGVLVPKFQYDDIIRHLTEVLEEVDVTTVVINGDLKHEFGGISEQEWTEVLKFLDFLSDYDVVLVRGNHDTILGPIANRKDIGVVDSYHVDGIYITHGHKILDDEGLKKSNVVVIGHDHPAVGLRDEARVEKVKCFLVGEWKNKTLIVLPSLNFVTEGTDITQEKTLSPFLEDVQNFEVYGFGKEVLYFGKVKNI